MGLCGCNTYPKSDHEIEMVDAIVYQGVNYSRCLGIFFRLGFFISIDLILELTKNNKYILAKIKL